jgi:hypothetical protein
MSALITNKIYVYIRRKEILGFKGTGQHSIRLDNFVRFDY